MRKTKDDVTIFETYEITPHMYMAGMNDESFVGQAVNRTISRFNWTKDTLVCRYYRTEERVEYVRCAEHANLHWRPQYTGKIRTHKWETRCGRSAMCRRTLLDFAIRIAADPATTVIAGEDIFTALLMDQKAS